jgi:hypothetical protein
MSEFFRGGVKRGNERRGGEGGEGRRVERWEEESTEVF